jgi:hypothetical protein
MSKALVIITRYINEYDLIWGFSNDEPVSQIAWGEDYKVILIKKDQGADFAEYASDITEELAASLPREVGIIFHLVNGDREAPKITAGLSGEIRARLKFCKSYSGTWKEFWDGTGKDNNLPYNSLVNAVKNGTGQRAAFIRVWNFFLDDPLLEAKLGLLQKILGGENPSAMDDQLKDFKMPIESFLSSTKGKDIFSTDYSEAYEKLLSSLELE